MTQWSSLGMANPQDQEPGTPPASLSPTLPQGKAGAHAWSHEVGPFYSSELLVFLLNASDDLSSYYWNRQLKCRTTD